MDEIEEPSLQEVLLTALENDLKLLRSGDYEITHYLWEQDFDKTESEDGTVRHSPSQSYSVKLEYRKRRA